MARPKNRGVYDKPTKQMYFLVTKDKYELPLAFADTAAELAEIVGVSGTTSICNTMSKSKTRKSKRCQYVKVEFDDNEEWGEEYK